MQSPKVLDSSSAAQSSDPIDLKQRSPKKDSVDQLDGAVELPGDVPRDTSSRQETSKKGGFHIHLGSKSKKKDHGSGLSSSKSLSILRKPPHSQQSLHATPDSKKIDATTPSAPNIEAKQHVDSQPSPLSVSPPRRSSPDPGLPSPPALASKKFSGGCQPNAYTALPDVLATAQRAKTVKASLTISIPSLAGPESEKTPRVVPSQPAEAVHTKVTPAELPSDDPNKQVDAENDVQNTSNQSNLDGPGQEVPIVDTARASEQQTTAAQDGEKTPTTGVRGTGETLAAYSTAPQEIKVEPIDTTLTSATMRTYSDFYKLPPQQTSPTPPPITPDDLAAIQSTVSNVASSVDQSRAGSVRETGASKEQASTSEEQASTSKEQANTSKEQLDTSQSQQNTNQAQSSVQVSSRRSPQPQGGPRETKPANPRDLRLNLRNKDLQNQSELFDLISATPPQSPIHARTPSDGSAGLNAVGRNSSASRILAPPEEAPPPPAPGGRSMITPDYAAAGAFEGERKSRRGSAMSTGGWKKMFGGGASGPPASPGGGPTSSVSMGQDEEVQMSANMMNGEGNDVLWYKGMGRDGLWVSGA